MVFVFIWLLISLSTIPSRSIHAAAKGKSSFTAVRGESDSGGLGEQGEGIKQKTHEWKNLTDTDNSLVIITGKGGWGQVEESKGGISGNLTLGGEHTIQYTGDIV